MEIKNNILPRAKVFIENINEFAPFGAPLPHESLRVVYFK